LLRSTEPDQSQPDSNEVTGILDHHESRRSRDCLEITRIARRLGEQE